MKNEMVIYTVKDICEGFVFSNDENKGLYGLNGNLVIQPKWQRNYIYGDGKKDVDVILSLLSDINLGFVYFVKNKSGIMEVLDGQQRITTLGRFLLNSFPIIQNGDTYYFKALPPELKEKILQSKIYAWECDGTEEEITNIFKKINIQGVPLTNQEIRNAVYSGPFVENLKKIYSNSSNPLATSIYSKYINGRINRQEILETIISWASKGYLDKNNISEYMSAHRYDSNISYIVDYINNVFNWIDEITDDTESGAPVYDKTMKGVDWGRLYDKYSNNEYDHVDFINKVKELLEDPSIKLKKNIYEYVLGGCQDSKILEVRFFDNITKKKVYDLQTKEAMLNHVSNCPLCALDPSESRRNKIYKLEEMDADHVTPWSCGGSTSIENCQMLCKTHNRSKGNK